MNKKYERLEGPPGPLFAGEKERDFVKQVNDELLQRVIGQTIVYYPISMERTNFHPLYGEAIEKTFLNPIVIFALVEWTDTLTTTTTFGSDNLSEITINFHKRRLSEDQELYVREGDFIAYDGNFYEITQTQEPRLLFGQDNKKFEITAKCIKARRGLFDSR